MRELSLNILDIAQNSVVANAKTVTISVLVESDVDKLVLSVSDDGKGMSKEMLENVIDPFTTTRTTRKVGMGIPLFKESAEVTGGSFEIRSEIGVGTTTTATYVLSSIDRMPIGDLAGTMQSLFTVNNDINFVLKINADGEEYEFSTDEAKRILEVNSLEDPDVSIAIYGMLDENIKELLKGVV